MRFCQVDPSFKVVARAYPHVLQLLLRDKSPEMRNILAALTVDPATSAVRWARIRRLLAAASAVKPTSSASDASSSSVSAGKQYLALLGRLSPELSGNVVDALDDAIAFLLRDDDDDLQGDHRDDAADDDRHYDDDSASASAAAFGAPAPPPRSPKHPPFSAPGAAVPSLFRRRLVRDVTDAVDSLAEGAVRAVATDLTAAACAAQSAAAAQATAQATAQAAGKAAKTAAAVVAGTANCCRADASLSSSSSFATSPGAGGAVPPALAPWLGLLWRTAGDPRAAALVAEALSAAQRRSAWRGFDAIVGAAGRALQEEHAAWEAAHQHQHHHHHHQHHQQEQHEKASWPRADARRDHDHGTFRR